MQIRRATDNRAISVEIRVTDINLFKSFVDNPDFRYTFEEEDMD